MYLTDQQISKLKSAIAENQKVEAGVIEKFIKTKGFFDKRVIEERCGKIEKQK